MKTRTINMAVAALIGASSLCASSACAQSLEVYGLVGAYLGSVKRSGDPAAVTQVGGGGLTTSYLGFRGKEDLGGGVKAIFSLEAFYRPDTGEQGRNATDPLFSRNAWVGIEGSLGRLTVGRQTNPTYAVMSQLSPFGSSVVFSPLALQTFVVAYGSNIIGDTVWNNTIQYATPTVGGFRGTGVYGAGEVPGSTGTANLGLHGTFTRGKFMAAISTQRVRVVGVTPVAAQQEAWLAGATYDFTVAKVYANAVHTSIEQGASTRMLDAGISVPLSAAGTFMIEAARSRIEPPGRPQTHRTTASVGYDYRLSKRTDVYAIYVHDKRSTAASAGTKAIGIRHVF
jgi:predicted porin